MALYIKDQYSLIFWPIKIPNIIFYNSNLAVDVVRSSYKDKSTELCVLSWPWPQFLELRTEFEIALNPNLSNLAFGCSSDLNHLNSALGEYSFDLNHSNSALGKYSSDLNHSNSAIGEYSSDLNHSNSALGEYSSELNHSNSALGEYSSELNFWNPPRCVIWYLSNPSFENTQ